MEITEQYFRDKGLSKRATQLVRYVVVYDSGLIEGLSVYFDKEEGVCSVWKGIDFLGDASTKEQLDKLLCQ